MQVTSVLLMNAAEREQQNAEHWPPSVPDWVFAPAASGALLLIVGVTGLLAHRPWLFASLAPSAYELAEKPELPGSRLYNAIIGQLIGVGGGFFAVWVLAAWDAPPVMSSRHLTPERVWCCVVAIAVTSFVGVLLKAFHPAAAATALLIALGAFSTRGDAVTLIAGILILGFCGYFVRHIRLGLHQRPKAVQPSAH